VSRDELNVQNIASLRSVYPSVNDIDLYIAGLSERPWADASIGPTILCIVGDQFTRLKKGDRFFYENGGQNSSFTLGKRFSNVFHGKW
jgi:peroxidase